MQGSTSRKLSVALLASLLAGCSSDRHDTIQPGPANETRPADLTGPTADAQEGPAAPVADPAAANDERGRQAAAPAPELEQVRAQTGAPESKAELRLGDSGAARPDASPADREALRAALGEKPSLVRARRAAPPGAAGPATGGPATPGPGGGGRGFLAGGAAEDEAESYAALDELGFVATAAEPLSTFAADVDTASFSNLRRFLREGRLPPKRSVRVEEFVNAQDYRDPDPDAREPFAITTEVGPCPWQERHRLLRVGLKTRAIDTAKVPPCNLVFLIDVSGSMNRAEKLPLVVRAMRLLVDQLRPQDRVAIVTYASGVKVPLESATGADQDRIHEVLTDLRAGGSTAGQGGIQRAYEIALANLVPEGVNRVILATDGDFNVGIRSPDELEAFIGERKDAGVFLTVLGVGGGNLKDDRLERLANKGNGVYAYLDTLAEARRVLVEQFGASMMTVAKDVKLQLQFDPALVAGYRQIGYENRQLAAHEFRDDKKDAGELGAGHAMTALYELVPAGVAVPGQPAGEAARPAAAQAADGRAIATLRVRYKPPLADAARELARPVEGAAAGASPSRDFLVAAGAAVFGMLLRGSAHVGGFGFDELQALLDDPDLQASDLADTVAGARALWQQQQPQQQPQQGPGADR